MGPSFYILSLIIGDLAMLSIGAWAWRRNTHSAAARSFFIMTLTFCAWLTINYYSLGTYTVEFLTLTNRLSYAGGIWVTVAVWAFCWRFPTERKPSIITQLLSAGVLAGGTLYCFTPFLVDSIRYEGAQHIVIVPGKIYWLYGVLVVGIIGAAMMNLRRNYKTSDLLQRNQVKYVAFGIGLGAALAIVFDVILVLLDPRWGNPLINMAITMVIVLFLGYGLIRHRYTDVHRLSSIIVTYLICLGLVAGELVLAGWILARLYPGLLIEQKVSLLLIATASVFAIQPLKRWIKHRADKFFNVGWYETQVFLNTIGTMLAGEQHLAPLLSKSLGYLCEQLQVTAAELVVLSPSGNYSERFGDWQDRPSMVDAHELPRPNKVVILDELPADDPLKQQFEKYAVRICLPLQTRGQTIGYMFLGIKRHGDIYSQRDISVLQILSSQLAVSIISAQAFDQISRFNSTLQGEIAKATADLRAAHEKLKLDDRMKTEFIMLTSHNLRTPLSIIKGYSSLLEESPMTDEQRKLLDSIKTGTDRLSQFTEDLLTIDSIVAGNEMRLEATKAEDVLLPLAKEAQELATTKKVQFQTQFNAGGLVINANLPRLSGAIRNLLDNAFKFAQHGQVIFSAEQAGDKLNITVADSGIGIAASELPNIFSKFHRATSTEAYNYEGEGIGLYLTNLVVKEHGGHITATSQLGKGSKFTVSLPIKT